MRSQQSRKKLNDSTSDKVGQLSGMSISSTELSKGFLLMNFNPENKDPRKRIKELAEKYNEKHDYRSAGMLLRKLCPVKMVSSDKIETEKDVKKVRDFLMGKKSGKNKKKDGKKDGKKECTRYEKEHGLISKIYRKIKNCYGLKIQRNCYREAKCILFFADVHVNSYEWYEDCVEKSKTNHPIENYEDWMQMGQDPYLSPFETRINGMVEQVKGKYDDVNDIDDILFVFLGDLTDFGTRAEFKLFHLLLHRAKIKNVVVIPGNHDLYSFYGCQYQNAQEQGKDFNRFVLLKKSGDPWYKRFPKLVTIGANGGVKLVLLDSNSPGGSVNDFHPADGLLTKEGRNKLKEIITPSNDSDSDSDSDDSEDEDDEKKVEDSFVILCLHHHADCGSGIKLHNEELYREGGKSMMYWLTRLKDSKELKECVLQAKCVKMIVFGHLHVPFHSKWEEMVLLKSVGSLRENSGNNEEGRNKGSFCTVFHVDSKITLDLNYHREKKSEDEDAEDEGEDEDEST